MGVAGLKAESSERSWSLRRIFPQVLMAALVVLLAAAGAGCGQPDYSKVDIDNPVLDAAWSKYSEAREAGVDDTFEKVRLDLTSEEEDLKQYYLETGDNRNADIEAVIAWLTAEIQKQMDGKLAADASGQALLPLAEQEKIFAQIRPLLESSLSEEQYIYAMAVSRSDPTWALAWFDGETGDFVIDGPVVAVHGSGKDWLIKYAGHDIAAIPGLPDDLVGDLDAYTWLSDDAWVVTQTESYAKATRPDEDYAVGRFQFDAGMGSAYVYLQYPEDTLGFRYQKTEHCGWALVEVDTLAAE